MLVAIRNLCNEDEEEGSTNIRGLHYTNVPSSLACAAYVPAVDLGSEPHERVVAVACFFAAANEGLCCGRFRAAKGQTLITT